MLLLIWRGRHASVTTASVSGVIHRKTSLKQFKNSQNKFIRQSLLPAASQGDQHIQQWLDNHDQHPHLLFMYIYFRLSRWDEQNDRQVVWPYYKEKQRYVLWIICCSFLNCDLHLQERTTVTAPQNQRSVTATTACAGPASAGRAITIIIPTLLSIMFIDRRFVNFTFLLVTSK